MNNLRYTKPNPFKHEFHIIRDENRAGTLVYKNILHRQAAAHMDGLAMELRQGGLARTEVTVIEENTDKVLGVYRKPAIGRTGQILLGDTEYTFSKVSKPLSLRPSYSWKDSEGAELITFRMTGMIRNAGEIVVAETVLEPQDRNVLIPLGLFNCINREESSSTAVAS
ncbi:MAG: hypothetical protein WAS36_03500 [Candidatus Saccharimonadales bacterium]